jgi:putative transposase
VIERHENEYSIGLMCRVLEVSRTGYYAYRHRPTSERELENRLLVRQIRRVQQANRKSYGSPRMMRELRDQGRKCGRHRVARLMRENGLGARRKKRFRKTTDSRHSFRCAENLVEREFTVDAPNRVWVSDVTYIWTREGWLYLAAILDLYSRKAVGWGLGVRNDTDLVLRALRMAIARRHPESGLIFHSDRGSTYAADLFTAELRRHGFVPSMSRKGDCWDNAVAESFFSSLKTEWLWEGGYDTVSDAMGEVFSYVEMFYNPRRRHSYLGYQSPDAFEAARCA